MAPSWMTNWMFGFTLVGFIIFVIIVLLIALVLLTIFLKIALGIVDAKNTDFGEVFTTALVMVLIGWIPCIGCILSWIIIDARHDTGFLVAIVVWFLTFVIAVIVAIIILIAILGIIGISIILPSI